MIRINDREVVFQTSVILRPEETAVITTPETCGFNLKLKAGAKGVMPQSVDEMEKSVVGNEFTFDIPFLDNNFTINYHNDLEYAGRTVTSLFAGHGVGDWMVIHVQFIAAS
jgi:hypothetical protein